MSSSGDRNVVFRAVRQDEAEKVCKFGEQEFARTFRHLYSEEDYNQFVVEGYTPALYTGWMENPEYVLYGAFSKPSDSSSDAQEEMVGYVLAGLCSLPLPAEELKGDSSTPHGEVKRLYVHPTYFGCGIAEQLLRYAISWLRSGEGRQNRDIYLGVFSENPRAIKFYGKHNFKHCGEYEFVVGNQLDREFIMKNAGTGGSEL